jgi:DnaJ-class molecular chaperone
MESAIPEDSDLYKRLGLSNSATEQDIKKAYHKLSLKYHPDRNNNSPESVKTFQLIGEAYETLGDISKRKQYDLTSKLGGIGNIGNPFGDMPPFSSPEELFSQLFSMSGANFPPGANVKFTTFSNGVPVNMDFKMGENKPTAITKKIQIEMDIVLNGGKIPIEYERWVLEGGIKRVETTKIYVDIIQGIDNNETILVKNVGNIMHENSIGDLKLIVEVINDTEYTRNGLDLHLHKVISLKDALCGFTFEMKYLNGKAYNITNQKGNIIVPQYIRTIPQMGLTRGDKRGNLIIQFHVQFPTSLSENVVDKLKELL